MRRKKLSAVDIIIHIVLALGALLCLLPVLNMVAISLSETSAAATGTVYLWPKKFTLASYEKLLSESNFFKAFGVSIKRVLATLVVAMPITITMAYALSKEKKYYRERNIIMWLAIITMMFSGGLIPSYITIKNYGLINNFWVLVIPGALNVWNIIIMMNYFRSIPHELEEAAMIDGAGAWRTLVRVFLPISLPTLATITLFTVVNSWNDFFTGLVYITKTAEYPLQTYIRSLTVKIDFTSMNPTQLIERMKVSSITFNAAKIVVSMIPVMLVYPFLQRYFVSGLVMGSVKG